MTFENKELKVLFIHLPHLQDSARLDTMSFAFNVVNALAERGVRITICLWETCQEEYRYLDRWRNVRLVFFRQGLVQGVVSKFSFLSPWAFSVQVAPRLRHRFHYIFTVGQRGLVIGRILQHVFGGRLIYLNDEFPSCWHVGRWNRAEKAAAAHTDLIVVPDKCRVDPLLDELALPRTHRTFALPNAPLQRTSSAVVNWNDRLGIPPDSKFVLHAGTVADWAQIPEVLFTIRDWPTNCVFLIHSRSCDGLKQYRRSLMHLHEEGRVFWSTRPLTQSELSSLISAASCTLALYRNTGANFEHVGMSSGKMMRSIVLGVPVVASRLDSLNFVEQNRLGVLVEKPYEIPKAIETVLSARQEMRENCFKFRESHLSFDSYWHALWQELERSRRNLDRVQ